MDGTGDLFRPLLDLIPAAWTWRVVHYPADVLARRVRDVLSVDCGDALLRCRAPILYLAAADDALVGTRSREALRSFRPDVRVVALPGPHLLLQAQPRAAWQEIEQFLRES